MFKFFSLWKLNIDTCVFVCVCVCLCVCRATWPPWPIREFQRTWRGRTGLCSETSTRSMTGTKSESETSHLFVVFSSLTASERCPTVSDLLVFHDGLVCHVPCGCLFLASMCVDVFWLEDCSCLTACALCHTVISWESWRSVWVLQTAWPSSSSNMWVTRRRFLFWV